MSKKIVSTQTVSAIEQFLSQCEKFKTPIFGANSATRTLERGESGERFSYYGDGIELEFSISLSRNNCYVTKTVVIDGRKTTARALRKFVTA